MFLDFTWLLFPSWRWSHYSALHCFSLSVANGQHGWKDLFLALVAARGSFCLRCMCRCWCSWGGVMKSSGPIWFWQRPVETFHKLGMDHCCCLPGNSIRSVPFPQRRFHCLWNEVVMHWVRLLFAIIYGWPPEVLFFVCLFDTSHHEAYCHHRNTFNTFSDLHKTNKQITQPQNTPVSECWGLISIHWIFPGPPLCPESDTF